MTAISRLTAGRPQRVLLVGFQDQDNLGLRYLMSAVNAAGHLADIVTYQSDPEPLLQRVRAESPDVIGFSLIFQYMAPDFGRVIGALRQAEVGAHVTMGGHYPSFDYAEVLDKIPGLDTIVRYDGELTLVELLHHLAADLPWRGIDGLAFRLADGKAHSNKLRDPIDDLDELPWPDRTSISYERHPFPTASILGSRGCPWNCSFCSIRPFYENQGGKLRRLRSPERVVDEMIHLLETRSVSTFLFQDDDFLATGRRAREWAGSIADLIRTRGFGGRMAFKISCRSDEVEEETMRRMMAGGLTHVYMGVESGDEIGLSNMNKMIRPETHLRAARILKSLGLSFDFGFMLMDPSSTFDSIRNNIAFLEQFVGDGWSVAPFCRMLPYAGTPIRRELEAHGRLVGTPFEPDYHFLDPKLDLFYDWMLAAFHRRNFTSEGLCHLLRYSLFEARLRLPGANPVSAAERAHLQFIAAICNRVACGTLRAALAHVEATPLAELETDREFLDGLLTLEQHEEARLTAEYREYRRRIDARRVGVDGGFDKSWTHWAGDREAAGIGAA
ncbi:MAG: B12-binding domain-containing radical SAM protein [Gemmatimonadales bacterium]